MAIKKLQTDQEPINVIHRLPEFFDIPECTGLLPVDCRVHSDPVVKEVNPASLSGTLAFQNQLRRIKSEDTICS